MDIRQLRYFLGIVDAGSISAAAVRLRVAQPALSQQLARLEADLGASLMERGPRGVMLTAAGGALRDHARIVLRDLERAREAVQAEASGPVRGAVAIGLPTTVAMAITLPLLRTMRDQHPAVTLHLVESQSGHLLEWMRQGKIDLAVLFDATGVRAEPLLVEDLHFASPMDTPFGAAEEISLACATALPVLLPGREHGFRRLLDNHASAAGHAWNVVAEVDALPHLKRAVAAGLAHTVLPPVALREEIAGGLLRARRIVDPVLRRTVMLALPTERPPSRVHLAARDCVAALVRELVERGEWRGHLCPPR
jgi:LysR family nitrogen assimilation transcriptional regulator